MSFEIQDRLSLTLRIGGREFPFDRVNTLTSFHCVESSKIAVPMVDLTVTDQLDFLASEALLADGVSIEVSLHSRTSSSGAWVGKFLLNSFRRTTSSGVPQYRMDGYLDAAAYWHSTCSAPISGTSHAALQEIAQRCALKYEGEPTSDSQTWVPRNLNTHEWARQISERGYASDTSCFQLALRTDKTLVYRDVGASRPVAAKFSFADPREGFFTASDIQPIATPGTGNHHIGYKADHRQQSIFAAGKFSSVKVNKTANDRSLLVSQKVRDNVSQGRVSFSPINIGNVSDTFEEAVYQNRRLNALFSESLSLITPDRTNVGALDSVHLAVERPGTSMQAFTGDYVVVSKVVFVRGTDYVEKFDLVRKASPQTLPQAL